MGLREDKELKLQKKIIDDLHGQGWYAEKTSDRFKAGRPDLRIGHSAFGQMDVELKYNDWPEPSFQTPVNGHFNCGGEYKMPPPQLIDSTMTKLQWLNIKKLNDHGMPAVCLIYFEAFDFFGITTLLRDTLPGPGRRVLSEQTPRVISGPALFKTAMEYLREEARKR